MSRRSHISQKAKTALPEVTTRASKLSGAICARAGTASMTGAIKASPPRSPMARAVRPAPSRVRVTHTTGLGGILSCGRSGGGGKVSWSMRHLFLDCNKVRPRFRLDVFAELEAQLPRAVDRRAGERGPPLPARAAIAAQRFDEEIEFAVGQGGIGADGGAARGLQRRQRAAFGGDAQAGGFVVYRLHPVLAGVGTAALDNQGALAGRRGIEVRVDMAADARRQ